MISTSTYIFEHTVATIYVRTSALQYCKKYILAYYKTMPQICITANPY